MLSYWVSYSLPDSTWPAALGPVPGTSPCCPYECSTSPLLLESYLSYSINLLTLPTNLNRNRAFMGDARCALER